jgi:glycosyltransferase involved in cell wall biosynthesis
MKKNKFICILRVKDGIFFANRWLDRMDKLVDEIVAVDNGSTDGTLELLKAHPRVTDVVETVGFDEGRDKNLVYERARLRNPDWLIWLDIDEIIEEEVTRAHFDKLMNSGFRRFSLRRFHFTNENRFAASQFWIGYTTQQDRYMWKESPKGYFENVVIDSPNVKGIGGILVPTNIRIKHLGYINKKLVDIKANIYREIIPEKEKTFQRMYLEGVRSWKWISNRRSLKVRLLNIFLDLNRYILLFLRQIGKVVRLIRTLIMPKN